MKRRSKFFYTQYPGAEVSQKALFFGPGVLLVLVGVLALIAPRFIAALIALFFIFLGAGFCYITWKFMQLRSKFEKFTQEFDGKIYVQGVDIHDDYDVEIDPDETTSKKVTYH